MGLSQVFTNTKFFTLALSLFALIAAPLMLTGCSVSPATGSMQLVFINPDQEIAMGVKAAPELEKQYGGAVDDPVLQQYVNGIGQRVAANAERDMPWEFTLVYSDTPNAFALPGGKIFVTAGLMKSMSHDRQLAAVLGHEIGHVTDRHSVLNLERQLGIALLAELAGYAADEDYRDIARAGATIAGTFVNLSYSRQQEYTADSLGVRYMSRAGYDPNGMVELLEILQDGSESSSSSVFAEMIRTHPLTENRIEAAKVLALENFSADLTVTGTDSPNRMPEMTQRLKIALQTAKNKDKADKKTHKPQKNPQVPVPALKR